MTPARRARRGAPAALLLAALAAVSLAGCSPGGEPAAATLRIESGDTEIRRGSDSTDARGQVQVRAGDRLTVDSGTAVLMFDGGRQIELRDGSRVTVSGAGSGRELSLVSGDALVLAPQGRAVRIEASGTHLAVLGEARLTRHLAVVLAVYSGQADVQSAGQELRVPALRQVSVPAAGLLPAAPEPLAFSASDPWDQRLLGGAIDLGGQLVARSRGFTAQLPDGAGTAQLFRRLFPQLGGRDSEVVLQAAGGRAPGEALVGTAVALLGRGGDFATRAGAVFALRDAGADWGLIALEQGVERVPLLESIDAAIRRAPTRFGSPEGTSGVPGGSRPQASVGSTGGGSSPSGAPGPGSGSVPPSGSAPGTGQPGGSVSAGGTVGSGGSPTGGDEVGTLNTGIDVVDNVVNDLVDTLSGLLRSLGPG